MIKKDKVNVEDNVKRIMKKENRCPASVSWQQINRIAEGIWINSGKLEYIGAYRDTQGKMCCVFREMTKNANNSYHYGKIFSVENDVVFTFQEDGKRITRRRFDEGAKS